MRPRPAASPLAISFDDIAAAHERIRDHARRTPALSSATIDRLTGARVHLKCENLQRMGAFKFRGAYNALAQLGPDERKRGVVAFSSGNHGQAVALAGQMLDIPATIVMPEDAPRVKLDATRGYGADVVLYKRSQDRQALAKEIAARHGLTVIPPYDHPHIMAGQGTAAKELIEDAGPLDVLLVPCGGGGLIAGCAVAARALSPQCRVIGVEPAAGDDGQRSFKAGRIVEIALPRTLADGARTTALGKLTFPVIRDHVADMLTVGDAELLRATLFLWERTKMVVEPTGALGFAALHADKFPARSLRIGVILSGGNADFAALAREFVNARS